MFLFQLTTLFKLLRLFCLNWTHSFHLPEFNTCFCSDGYFRVINLSFLHKSVCGSHGNAPGQLKHPHSFDRFVIIFPSSLTWKFHVQKKKKWLIIYRTKHFVPHISKKINKMITDYGSLIFGLELNYFTTDLYAMAYSTYLEFGKR